MEQNTPIEAFVFHAHAHADKTFLIQPKGDEVITITYAEALDIVTRLATWLERYPINSNIGILSLNCMHWFITDLAIMMAGHVSVPIYPTASTTTINQILEHSECKCLFLGKMPEDTPNIKIVDSQLEIVSMFTKRDQHFDWDELIATDPMPEIPPMPSLDQLATIVYTSGTTGMPKGVMIDYRALKAAGDVLMDYIQITKHDRFFSYLPLAHVAERTAVEMASIYAGGQVSFVNSLDTFNDDLVNAKPTVFFGVPRIWIKFQQAIESKIPSAVLSTILSIPFIGNAFAKKLRQKLGLDQVRFAVSGAAAIPIELLKWYERIGVNICEAYGMSESLGSCTFNHPDFRQIGSVGKPVPGTEVEIMENGEVAYRSPSLMQGYYKEPALTEQTIKDGLLLTGDIGHLDEDGYLWITGRVKDIFKTEKGKYIAPSPIESELIPRSGFEQLCVMGANLTQPVVLSPMPEKPSEAEFQELANKLEAVLEELNSRLTANERISHWFLVAEDWTIENNLITPTLKLRRQEIESLYADSVRKQTHEPAKVQWLKIT